VVLPILDGLELVHNAGFIHRDIKPDNIHIRADGSPVLLDFGSARHSLGHARTVTILVAPGYAPFEQYYSSGENQGPWTDLYSMGATCYRAIAGIAPMDAIARSKGILGSTLEILVPAATIGSGRYSAGLLKAVDHALQFAEKDRPQNIAEWRKELAAAGKPVTRTAPPPAATAQSAAPAASLRGPILWATLGALVAAVAVVLWLVPPQEKPNPPAPGIPVPTHQNAEDATALAIQAAPPRESQDEERAASKRAQTELEGKLAALELRLKNEAEARNKADARVEAEARKRAEAERKRQEEARRTAAAAAPPPVKSVEPTPTPVPAPAPAPAPAPDLLALAEQARARGNEAEALALTRKAADQGNAKAQFALGEMYAAGRGVPQNNFQAYVWFSRAARAGNAEAKTRVEQVKAALQPAEIQQANKLLR